MFYNYGILLTQPPPIILLFNTEALINCEHKNLEPLDHVLTYGKPLKENEHLNNFRKKDLKFLERLIRKKN